jgi:DNA-binding MarR family transcriptional regulator
MLSALTRRVLEGGVDGGGREGVSFIQISILKWIDSAGPRRAQDVARFLSASAPAATQILARLRRKGLIRSRRSLEDRRAEDLFLTPRARALVRRHDALRQRRVEKLARAVPEARLRTIAQGLEAAIGMLLSDGEPVADLCLHCGALESPGCVMRQFGYRCPTEREGAAECGRA